MNRIEALFGAAILAMLTLGVGVAVGSVGASWNAVEASQALILVSLG